MRKHCKRRKIVARPPIMVVASTIPELGITPRQGIEAMRRGYATTEHFDDLADTRDLLTLAAADRNEQGILAICEAARVALESIKSRHHKCGKIGATANEIFALMDLCTCSDEFWSRQSGSVFATHYDALRRYRRMQAGQPTNGTTKPASTA